MGGEVGGGVGVVVDRGSMGWCGKKWFLIEYVVWCGVGCVGGVLVLRGLVWCGLCLGVWVGGFGSC